MKKIEQVARAICRTIGTVPEESYWSTYIPEAVAAIRAMKEPTSDMLDAGTWSVDENNIVNIQHIYNSMIDEALEEYIGVY